MQSQKNDTFCKQITEDIKKGKNQNFVYDIDGLLYIKEPDGTKLVVPQGMITKILKTHHDCVFSVHISIKKTLGLIKQYYWPSLTKDVTDYVSICQTCQLRKPGKRATASMGLHDTVKTAMHMVSMDIVGPLSVTRTGNRYLLSFIDHATRWVEAIPIVDQTAESVPKAFVTHIIARLRGA